jgi:hypothetical protein
VFVSAQSEGGQIGRTDWEVSPLLKNLYVGGKASGIKTAGGGVLLIYWMQSAAYSNQLGESLDLRPGEDFLRFVPADSDAIKQTTYRAHLARAEFPQSSGGRYFFHDRNDDHAVPVLLMPPSMTQNIIEKAKTTPDKSLNDKVTFSRSHTFIDSFDRGTAAIGRVLTALAAGRNYEDLSGFVHHDFWEIPSFMNLKMRKKNERLAADELMAHYNELVPKLAALQAATPALIERKASTDHQQKYYRKRMI